MKNTQIAFMVIMIFTLCNCVSKEPLMDSAIMDIAYKDKSGNDLLNSSTQNHYSADNIHIFNVTNGIKKEVYHVTIDDSQPFFIYKEDLLSEYFLRFYFATDTTLLQLNQTTTDTLTCVIDKSNGRLLKKLWYNGVLKWDDTMSSQMVTIIK
jgi:hypothetical protein